MDIDWNYIILFYCIATIEYYLWCTNTLFIFAVAIVLLIKQSKCTKHWDTFVSHCMCCMALKVHKCWLALLQQICHWFNNHMHPLTSGTGSHHFLKIKTTLKLVHPWQVFQNLFWKDNLKEKIIEEWETRLTRAVFSKEQSPTWVSSLYK